MFLLVFIVAFFLPAGRAEYSDAPVLLLGHAGSGFLSPLNPFNPLPANSMGSIVKAIEKHGADGVEVDVQLSKDGVFILYHDATLESMTEQTGMIEEHNASDVVGLEYSGGIFYDLFQDESIVTLEQMLQRFATYPELPYLHIDLRNYNPERHLSYAQSLVALLEEYNYPLNKLAFISPDPAFLEAFRQVEPEAILIADADLGFEETFKLTLAHNLNGICIDGKDISPEQMLRAKQKGLQVVLFGGKSSSRISKMIALKPDAIQVNNVETAHEMLE
ncbi:glycerophosphodiester phosphodiesterase [Pontibacter sp. MBLB2868]|uniref:glycerophosphodiester phosphodiesterase n=1 Tax=Pontibacter sp. MBLB2868 TaxID=3451555 RepID=UPI003F75485A